MSFFSQNKDKKQDIYLTIHGHFYQPPRENPWLNFIERQSSAHPFHDWNERITYECYMPNTNSRVLEGGGRIIDIVNNFEYINFNIGPTLFDYIEKNFSTVYERIIEADKRSVERFGGHGNAISQVYNHIILPLADDKDVRTQIKWGIYDFERRFGRQPESIWLSETAINYRVLRHLIDFGFKYVILSPFQAEKTRPLGSSDEEEEWQDVRGGRIDPRVPYRHFYIDADGKPDYERYIDIFFYDGVLAQKVSFEHLLRSADNFYNALAGAVDSARNGEQLIHYATDGEIYGHHEPFGDMALAYLAKYKIPDSPFKLTNYGQYLEKFPPAMEVRLDPGPGGEGTAWSCSHGVGRWYRNCGCSTGGGEGWNQEWRTPLREGFDMVRDELRSIYEKEARPLFKDIWQARDEFIKAGSSAAELDSFFAKHGAQELGAKDKLKALKLLEAQKYSMYMYTSCGWFFSDISGIETIQDMRYADMAIYQAVEYTNKNLVGALLGKLEEGKSNIKKQGDGRKIFEKYVIPYRATIRKVLALFLIERTVLCKKMPREFYDYYITLESLDKAETEDGVCFYGHINGKWDAFSGFDAAKRYRFFIPPNKVLDVRVYLDEVDATDVMPKFSSADDMKNRFSRKFIALNDFIYEARQRIVEYILQDRLKNIYSQIEDVYHKNEDVLEMYEHLKLRPPDVLFEVAKFSIDADVFKTINLLMHEYDENGTIVDVRYIMRLLNTARVLGLNLQDNRVIKRLSEWLSGKIDALITAGKYELADDIYNLIKLIYHFEFKLDLSVAQKKYFDFLKKNYKIIDDLKILDKLILLSRYLGLKIEEVEADYKKRSMK